MTFFCHPDCPTVQGWIDEERTEGMHTPEPWKVDPDDRPGYEWNNHIVSATDPNQTICFMTHDNTPENIEGEANARRIVACVNACKGIKTESLEMEVLSWITDETGENPLQRERDELLEARRACGERLIEVLQERDELRDEVEYHRTDAKKWALQALKFDKRQPIETVPKVGAGGTALEVHGTVFFKDNHQYRSQLRFPVADGAYELVKIENPDMTNPLFHVAGESFEVVPDPLQKLGARLAELLDEDQFAECEALLLAAGVKPYNELK